MAQNDLHLVQNVHPTLIEFIERIVNIGKGALLSADALGVPTVLAAGSNTYMLIRDDAEPTGLKWVAVAGGHTQGTDTGTTSNTFTVDSDGALGKIILDAANVGANYTTTIRNTTQAGNIILTLPAVTGTLATEDYAVAKTLFDANTILAANTDNTPGAVTVAEQTIIGRKTGGNITALTPAEAMGVLCVAAPATKTSAGITGQIAFDDTHFYRCKATNSWTRVAMATDW